VTAILIDGHSLVYRAYFALSSSNLSNQSGQETGAIHGFLNMLIKLFKDHNPDYLAIAFDTKEPSFRSEIYKDYKATRPETPDAIISQVDILKKIADLAGFFRAEVPGYEADDILGTLSKKLADQKIETIIVSGDRDIFQAVKDPYVKVLYNLTGVSNYVMLDENGVENRVGVKPELYPLFAALRGDKSDNLSGIPGVGEKRGAYLVNTYKTIDGIYSHLDDLKPKIKQSLAENKELLETNYRLSLLDYEVPIEAEIKDLRPKHWDPKALDQLFKELHIRSVSIRLKDLLDEKLATNNAIFKPTLELNIDTQKVPEDPVSVNSVINEPFDELKKVSQNTLVCDVSWKELPGRSPALYVGILRLSPDSTYSYYFSEKLGEKEKGILKNAFLSNEIIAFGVKDLLRYLGSPLVYKVPADLNLAAYLCDPKYGKFTLVELAEEFLSKDSCLKLANLSDNRALSKERLILMSKLHSQIFNKLNDLKMSELYQKIEAPLIGVLAKMEIKGVLVDKKSLEKLAAEFENQSKALEEKIQKMAQKDINVNSPSQLSEFLFNDLKLTPVKKIKSGYSTDAKTLEALRAEHPIIELLINYREIEKLRSTYGTGLLKFIDKDSRIRASFSQTTARTGRLSSDSPNLHNIPIRSPEGAKLRDVFVAPEGCELVVADYDQIELRIIAHLSNDSLLIEAFNTGKDLHSFVASKIFGLKESEVTDSQRSFAKTVSYGLVYGMEVYGLASRLAISNAEAKALLNAYFNTFPGLESYMKAAVVEARTLGYSVTETGRRRPLPELQSSNRMQRQAAERQAINAKVQGMAADIFKIALIELDKELSRLKADAAIVLQVHDEIILEVEKSKLSTIAELTRNVMENAYKLKVPLTVHLSWANTWGKAKSK
jgi:DNA polymerase-1